MPAVNTSKLARLKPDPLPTIHPLPEFLAEGDVKEGYEDTKVVLQVPWMGVVTMAFAHHWPFWRALWQGVRPLCLSEAYAENFLAMRRQTEEAVKELRPPPIAARLQKLGYAPREIAQIRDMVEVFSHGNFPYVFIATIARLLMEGHELSDVREAPAYSERHAPEISVPFLLMEPHHVDAPTGAVYERIKSSLGLPFVNTDYRAFARWPSYFALAWGDVEPYVTTDHYEEVVAGLHHEFVARALAMPNPGGLTVSELRAAASSEGKSAEILEMVRLFQWLLPGLVTNVAFFRSQLAGEI